VAEFRADQISAAALVDYRRPTHVLMLAFNTPLDAFYDRLKRRLCVISQYRRQDVPKGARKLDAENIR